jgi:hypothetical protein
MVQSPLIAALVATTGLPATTAITLFTTALAAIGLAAVAAPTDQERNPALAA